MITARPQDGGRTPVFILATGQGVEIAAEAGLAVVLGGPALFKESNPALERYREIFRPSPWWDAPYVVVSVNVAVAGTTADARRLLLPEARALAVSRTKGYFPPLANVADDSLTARQETLVEEALSTAIYGTRGEVERQLTVLQGRTGADELMITGGVFDLEAQSRSDELLAELAE